MVDRRGFFASLFGGVAAGVAGLRLLPRAAQPAVEGQLLDGLVLGRYTVGGATFVFTKNTTYRLEHYWCTSKTITFQELCERYPMAEDCDCLT